MSYAPVSVHFTGAAALPAPRVRVQPDYAEARIRVGDVDVTVSDRSPDELAAYFYRCAREVVREQHAGSAAAPEPTCPICGRAEGSEPSTSVVWNGSVRPLHDVCAERAS